VSRDAAQLWDRRHSRWSSGWWDTQSLGNGSRDAWRPGLLVDDGPVSTNLLPPGFWTFIDLDIAAVPRGSPSGCEESHVVLIPANGPSVGVFPGEVFYKRQLIDGTWTMGFETLSAGLSSGTFSPGRPWRFGRISLARVNDDLHAFRRSRKGLARAKSPGQSHASGWKRDSARVSPIVNRNSAHQIPLRRRVRLNSRFSSTARTASTGITCAAVEKNASWSVYPGRSRILSSG
jgi:hypothetical protein